MAAKYNLQYVTKDYPFMTCLVKVNTLYSWQKTVTKVLNKCHGIYSFRMNDDGLVEISGTVDPNLLLKMLGKSGRKAELRWFQFGECSSNLFMPITHSGYSQDGRYLHSDNLIRPKLPSHESLRSSALHQNHDYHITNQYSYHNNQDYQHCYDHNHDYQHGYCGHRHDYQDNFYGQNTYYQAPMRALPDDDFSCCSVM